MRKFLLVLISLSLITINACDDGNVIDVNLDFDGDFKACNGVSDAVFYNTKDDPSESLSFLIKNFQIAELIEVESDDSLEMTKTGTFYYRAYKNEKISGLDLFCSEVPSSDIIITQSDESSSTIVFNTSIIFDDNDGIPARFEGPDGINPIGDDDQDNVLNYLDDDKDDPTIGDVNQQIEDGFDTDRDGIPNFKDEDDDDDNVLTIHENPDPNGDGDPSDALNTDANLPNGDDIPDYLDPDDDGDETLTRDEEVLDQNEDPRDDDETPGIANYLNPDKKRKVLATKLRSHSYDSTFTVRATIFDIDLTEISQVKLDFGTLNATETTRKVKTIPIRIIN